MQCLMRPLKNKIYFFNIYLARDSASHLYRFPLTAEPQAFSGKAKLKFTLTISFEPLALASIIQHLRNANASL